MSLRPSPAPPIPELTARVTHQAFPQGHPYLAVADTFGPLFTDELFLPLFPSRGQPALAPWRLALVTLLQFAEGLSDRQAAEMVRASLLWKYLLRLELTDPGFDASVLSEFRTRLVAGGAERLLFDTLLERFREQQLLKERGRQRTDATHVQAAVRELNRLEAVGEAFRHTLNVLAEVAPQWLLAHADPAWGERYARPLTEWRLPQAPAAREALALQIGEDGFALLTALREPTAPAWLGEIPAVATLWQMWLQHYTRSEQKEGGGTRPQVRWRSPEEVPPAPQRLISPYDPEARAAKKRETRWLGYKVHFTETCDPEGPVLITDVQTRAAGEVDSDALPQIHAALAARNLLPAEPLVDAGYVDAGTLRTSREAYQIELVGPAPLDTAWQAQAREGFGAAAFALDWERQQAHCPGGKVSAAWGTKRQRGQEVLQISFAWEDCQGCAHREQCTRAQGRGRRLTLRPQAEYAALAAARARQQTAEFAERYAPRAGIEGTHSQAQRRCGVRRSRYLGAVKTHLQQLMSAAALNLLRMGEWLREKPRARTRQSAWVRLCAASA